VLVGEARVFDIAEHKTAQPIILVRLHGIVLPRKVIHGSHGRILRFTVGEYSPGGEMAKYGKAASQSVKRAIHKEKRGTLHSGKSGKGGVVRSRKQAIAIGLSEARKKGAKVPRQKSS
jgi:hypothetical protein